LKLLLGFLLLNPVMISSLDRRLRLLDTVLVMALKRAVLVCSVRAEFASVQEISSGAYSRCSWMASRKICAQRRDVRENGEAQNLPTQENAT
jgi:hypothetical protein